MAAYKRYSKDGDDDNSRPLPTQFQMNMGESSTSKHGVPKRGFVINMPNAVFMWFMESDNDDIPANSISFLLVDGYTFLKSAPLSRRFYAKIGQIHLLDPPANILSSSSKLEVETAAAHVKKQFGGNLPDSYMEAILYGVAPKIVADL